MLITSILCGPTSASLSPTTADTCRCKLKSATDGESTPIRRSPGWREGGPGPEEAACPWVRVSPGYQGSTGPHGLCLGMCLLWVKAKVLYHGALVAKDPKRFHQVPKGQQPHEDPPTHLATARRTWGSCSHFFRASTLLVFLWGLASRKMASDHRTPAIQTQGHTTQTPPLLSEIACPCAGYPERGLLRF